jgi:hypothetical protein
MKKTINITFPFIICLSLFVLFSVFEQNVHGNSNERNNIRSNNLIKYYFEMNRTEQKIFFENLKLVKIGDSIENVKKTMGEPTYDQKLVGKKGEFIARKHTCYIKRFKKGFVNEKNDKSVQFLFDINNKLFKIKSNINRNDFI